MLRGLAVMGSWLAAGLLVGCWADFPDSRFEADAAVKPDAPRQDSFSWTDQGTVDDKGIIADKGTHDTGPNQDKGPQPDTTPQPDKGPPPDTFTCTPNAFISCSAKDKLLSCNNSGDGTVEISCAPYDCNANIGACCQNVDKDSHTDCAGDCNDNDPLVHPGQTAYQTTASSGSFDYDCDKTPEPEYPNLVNCHFDGGKCVGSGWTSQVPACGASGSLVPCVKQGSKCDPNTPTTATQGCL